MLIAAQNGGKIQHWGEREQGIVQAGYRQSGMRIPAYDLPTVLPPSVAGLALLMTLGWRALIGGWLDGLGTDIAFTIIAVVIAQIFVAAPFYVRAATLGFAAIDEEIEQAALLDGASR